jgi:polyphenol oxidase
MHQNTREGKMNDAQNKEFGRTTHLSPNRRQLCEVLGAVAVGAASGLSLVALRPTTTLAQDTPDNCAPIGISGKRPVKFQPNTALPVRVRKSAFELSSSEVDRLKTAYVALRKLTADSPDDPRGWLRQGYVHCWYCGGGSNGAEGEEIHGSWRFFPWHRAFLYFHERILCKLIGDDTFALPYWDWDSQGRQTFPPVYGDPNDPANPLFDILRSARPADAIDPSVVSAPIMNPTMNAPTNNLFMGTQNGTAGAMENQPHGPIHIWTGDTTLQAANNDMGVLDTAAQDPVFFAHHGNIDRLWSVWLGLSPTHRNFTSPTWLTHVWQFYDENAVWTQIAISDVIDMENSLRVRYQPPSVSPIWRFTGRRAAVAEAANAAPEPALMIANAPEGIPLGAAPLTLSISLPPVTASAFSAIEATSAPSYVLHIEDLEVPADRQAYFYVYLNLPEANAETKVEAPNFVGTVTVLAKSKSLHTHQHAGVNAAFDITEALARVAKAAGGNLSITLVPAAATGKQPTQVAVGTPGVTFKRIYIDRI